MNNPSKPKLLFFRLTRPTMPAFMRLHQQEQAKCLSEFFEVVVISSFCDYRRVCDEHQPDLAVFESGGIMGPEREIANTSAYPEIPKLGFCNCDAPCQSRHGFLSDMARWGVENFFTHAVSLPSYTPSIADRFFVWPNFIDPSLYRDYGLAKVIPVLFTGNMTPLYPWRNRVNRVLSQNYPCLQSPHFGWFDERATAKMMVGESYARLINAAWFAPTCGTISNDLVRKHFEIPGCNTCLVTQRSPALEAAGFSDLVNCVFADDHDVIQKVEWLLQHPDELQRITRAGHDLVHSQHSIRQRDQVFQWFTLYKQLKPHQRIVQLGPFRPMTIVDQNSPIRNGHVESGGLDRALLAQGDRSFWSGDYKEAEALYLNCASYWGSPEVKLRLALCCLYLGKPELAIRWLDDPIQDVLRTHKDAQPDPVEWAYLIIALLCLGKRGDAAAHASQFQALHHPELDRARAVIRMLGGNAVCGNPNESPGYHRPSIHQLPEREMSSWLDELCKMLQACGQRRIMERLTRAEPAATTAAKACETGSPPAPVLRPGEEEHRAGLRMKLSRWRAARKVRVRILYGRLRAGIGRRVNKAALRLSQAVERRVGYFLPYRCSAVRNDECISTLHRLLREEDIKSGLLIGAAAGRESTAAFLAGMSENRNKPVAVCSNAATPRFKKLRRHLTRSASVRCRDLSSRDVPGEGQPEKFDAVVIDGSEMKEAGTTWGIDGARLVILNHINNVPGHNICQTLLANREYSLVAYNPSHRGGYAVFRRAGANGMKNLHPETQQCTENRSLPSQLRSI